MLNNYTQLSLFDIAAQVAEPPSKEQEFIDSAEAFLMTFPQKLVTDPELPEARDDSLDELLKLGKDLEFVKAAEAFMKKFWHRAPKAQKTPKQAFYHLFCQLSSQQHVSQARYLMHWGVSKKALADFYDAGDDAIALLPSMPGNESDAENLPITSDEPQNATSLNPDALQQRFDELFAIRQTSAESVYLRMLLDAEDPEIMFELIQEIAIGVDEFSGGKPNKAVSLKRAWATFNKEHELAQVYIKDALERWDN